jgi:hypothetical protein
MFGESVCQQVMIMLFQVSLQSFLITEVNIQEDIMSLWYSYNQSNTQHNHNDKQTIVRREHLPRPSSRGKLGAWTTLKTKKMN